MTTEWPESVWLLTDNCNISGDFGDHIPGWPDTTSQWVSYCLPTKEHRKEWWTMYYRFVHWEEQNIQLFNDLLNVTSRFDKWNELVRIRYNITFALLGYTEGQSQRILDISKIVQASAFFQKCTFVLYDHGSYYSMIERNAQKKTTPTSLGARRPNRGPGFQVYKK